MNKVIDLNARQILDSRGNTTVEVDMIIDNDIFGSGISPSGASTGILAAFKLRDGDHCVYMG